MLDFDIDHAAGHYYLVLRNYGPIIARDISIDVDPPFESALHDDVGGLERLRAWGRSVATLAPGVELRTLFDANFIRPLDQLADVYAARIRYWDDERVREFDETVTLDIATARGLGRLQSGKSLDDIHSALERIATALERRPAR